MRSYPDGKLASRCAALVRLASRAKRAGDAPAAERLWSQASEAGDLLAHRELAVHHEHRSRDLGGALAAAESGLALCARVGAPASVRLDFERRLARLLRKQARRRVGCDRPQPSSEFR